VFVERSVHECQDVVGSRGAGRADDLSLSPRLAGHVDSTRGNSRVAHRHVRGDGWLGFTINTLTLLALVLAVAGSSWMTRS